LVNNFVRKNKTRAKKRIEIEMSGEKARAYFTLRIWKIIKLNAYPQDVQCNETSKNNLPWLVTKSIHVQIFSTQLQPEVVKPV